MAKSKKTKKSPVRRSRRRIGAIGGGDTLNTLLGGLAGFTVGNMVSAKIMPTMDPKIKGAIQVALGTFLLPKFLGNSPLMRGMGLGFSISGGSLILKSTGLISGIGNRPDAIFLPAPGQGVNAMVSGNAGQGVNAMVNGRKPMSTMAANLYSN